jgi:hypothetical protein
LEEFQSNLSIIFLMRKQYKFFEINNLFLFILFLLYNYLKFPLSLNKNPFFIFFFISFFYIYLLLYKHYCLLLNFQLLGIHLNLMFYSNHLALIIFLKNYHSSHPKITLNIYKNNPNILKN